MLSRDVALFLARRTVVLVVQLTVIAVVVFSLLSLAPGSAEQMLAGTSQPTSQQLAAIRKEYNLDKPFAQQFWLWSEHVAEFDFGRSVRTSEPVTRVIEERLPTTLFLATYAMVIAVCLGVLFGFTAGTREGSTLDRAVVGVTAVAGTAPAFATGLVLLYVFGLRLGWLPVFGAGTTFDGRLRHLALPALALSAIPLALIARITRASVSQVLHQDFITFARARGIGRFRVATRYILRSSMVPIATACALMFGHLLAGAVVVEFTFSLQGLGSLLVDSIEYKDIPTVQALVLLSATGIIVMNLVVDLVAVISDPRISIGGLRRGN